MYQIMYLRKSRADRPDESVEEVLARHEQILQEYAERSYGSPIPEEKIYREVVSGETIEERPEMQKILMRMEDPSCDGVLVVDPQRLTRGDLSDCGMVVNAFRFSNTRIITPMHIYNLSDSMDRRFFQDELLRGNDYLEYTKMILSRGKYSSAKNGYYIGSVIPFGYKQIWIDKRPSLAIVEDEAYYVRMMFDMYLSGNGPAAIVKKLNNLGVKPRRTDYFSPEAVKSILSNPTYIGKIRWNRTKRIRKLENGKIIKRKVYSPETVEIFDGKHPAIIDEEIFNAVQKKKGSITRTRSDKKSINPLSGLLRCKHCGKVMHYNYKNGHPSYRCDTHYLGSCPQNGVRGNEVLDEVYHSLENNLQNIKVEIASGKAVDNSQAIQAFEDKLKDVHTQKEGLYEFLEKKIYTIEIFTTRRSILEKRENDLEKQIEALKDESVQKETLKTRIVGIKQAMDALRDDSISTKIKNQFLKDVIEVIYIDSSRPQRRSQPNDFDLEIKLK